MKKLNRLLALCLALLLALSMPVLAEETDAAGAESPVLFTFDGVEVTQAEVETLMINLHNNGYIDSATDYETSIQYMIEEKTIMAEIQKRGLDQFTAEEEEAFLADAQAEWDAAIESYVNYFLTEDTEEAREQAWKEGEAYYAAYGYSVEMIAQNLKTSSSYDKLEAEVLEASDLTITEDEIRKVFEEYAEQDKVMYEGNFATYEMYQNYGYTSWYKPEGFRGIIHILLEVDEELLNAYEAAQASYEETLSMEETETTETEDGEGLVTKEDVDAALQAILDSQKDAIDDIYARLAQGESFETLIAEYGKDGGMENEENLKNGYEVHPDSTMTWIPEFVEGAFSEKMQKPGDVSDPVVGPYGIHILYYLRDIPGGYVELTDDIRTEIENYLNNVRMSEVTNAALEQWMTEHEITYNQEAIDAAVHAATATAE